MIKSSRNVIGFTDADAAWLQRNSARSRGASARKGERVPELPSLEP